MKYEWLGQPCKVIAAYSSHTRIEVGGVLKDAHPAHVRAIPELEELLAIPALMPERLNLNLASSTDIASLPGIGRVSAKKIVERRANGPYVEFADFRERNKDLPLEENAWSEINSLVCFS